MLALGGQLRLPPEVHPTVLHRTEGWMKSTGIQWIPRSPPSRTTGAWWPGGDAKGGETLSPPPTHPLHTLPYAGTVVTRPGDAGVREGGEQVVTGVRRLRSVAGP